MTWKQILTCDGCLKQVEVQPSTVFDFITRRITDQMYRETSSWNVAELHYCRECATKLDPPSPCVTSHTRPSMMKPNGTPCPWPNCPGQIFDFKCSYDICPGKTV